jgi:hypothetical protein
MDSRSSLAARRSKLCSSGARSSCSGGRSSSSRVAEGMVRHGGSAAGSSIGWVEDGLAASGSTAASRAVSASWIAESAASVGSLIFFGVFAMSVVASYYAGPEQRRERTLTALRARLSLEIPSGTPSGSRQSRAAQTIHRRWAILSAWHTEGNCLLRRL